MEFYICERCGNIISKIKSSGVPVVCCGQNMTKLEAGTSDGAVEKHVPVIVKDGNKIAITVGSVEHPMSEAHLIEWIAVETTKGAQRKMLTATDEPKAEFLMATGEEFVRAYAYCNLHGLWMAE